MPCRFRRTDQRGARAMRRRGARASHTCRADVDHRCSYAILRPCFRGKRGYFDVSRAKTERVRPRTGTSPGTIARARRNNRRRNRARLKIPPNPCVIRREDSVALSAYRSGPARRGPFRGNPYFSARRRRRNYLHCTRKFDPTYSIRPAFSTRRVFSPG